MLTDKEQKGFNKMMKSLETRFLQYDKVQIFEEEEHDNISLYDLFLLLSHHDKLMLIGLSDFNGDEDND